jgi:hypothetical protein
MVEDVHFSSGIANTIVQGSFEQYFAARNAIGLTKSLQSPHSALWLQEATIWPRNTF